MFQNRTAVDPEFIDGGSHLMEPFAVEEKGELAASEAMNEGFRRSHKRNVSRLPA
jgi:hypothetical protein